MNVTLPDGSTLELPDGATGADAARAIGEGLARAALAVKQNGDDGRAEAPQRALDVAGPDGRQDRETSAAASRTLICSAMSLAARISASRAARTSAKRWAVRS